MSKILTYFFALLTFFLVSSISAPSVFSQEANQRWVCLAAERCDKIESCKNVVLPNIGSAATHRAWLSSLNDSKPLPNSKTYIIECIATNEGQICTTGKKETDEIVYGTGNGRLEKLLQLVAYKFRALFLMNGSNPVEASNPVMTNANGDIGSLIWADGTYHNTPERKFLALNYVEVAPTAGTNLGLGGQQLGTFSFDFESAVKDCISLRWDPYGRVFDSKSLEPVKGAIVSLLKKRGNDSFTLLSPSEVLGGNLENPQVVADDGLFSFVVPDGTYKLKTVKTGYNFPVSDLADINSNYTLVYGDIYPAATGEEIVQKGVIQHRDIPFSKISGSTSAPPKLMEYFYEAKPLSQTVSVEGRVSHPFTDISFWSYFPSDKIGRELLKIKADKLGNFKAEIDTSDFDKSKAEYFGKIKLKKNDLTLIAYNNEPFFDKLFSILTILVKRARAAEVDTSEVSLEPIPTILEGYAYNSLGKIIPNATVNIYEKLSTKPYFQTKTDETGFYKISSKNLPTSPYEIQYTTDDGVVSRIKTSEFVVQNQKYFAKNNIDLYVFKNSDNKIVSKESITAAAQSKSNKYVTIGAPERNQPQFSKLLVTIIVLVTLIISAVAFYFLYFRKKII